MLFLRLLVIILKEFGKLFYGFFQHLYPGKVDDTEMVGLLPVEALAGDQQQLFLPQKVKSELFIVGNIELFGIDLGKM